MTTNYEMVLVSVKQLTAAAAHLAFTASLILRDVASPGSGDSSAGLIDKVGTTLHDKPGGRE